MPMSRAELELMWTLKAVIGQSPQFVLDFAAGETTAEAEIAFARRLVDVAEQLVRHADAKEQVVLEGEVANVVDQTFPLQIEAGARRPD